MEVASRRGAYGTEEAAFSRVDSIRETLGIWPGVIRHKNGTFDLTYNPLRLVKETIDPNVY